MSFTLSALVIGSLLFFLPGFLREAQNRVLYVTESENSPSNHEGQRTIPFRRNVDDCILKGGCDKFNVTTADGLSLDNYLVLTPKPRTVIVFFHGNAGNIYESFHFASQLSRKTSSLVVMVDYRGYGLSDGKPSEDGLHLDALAVLQKVSEYARKYDLTSSPGNTIQNGSNTEKSYEKSRIPIIVHGHSLGAAVAIDIAASLPTGDKSGITLDGVVLSNAFLSIRDMVIHLCERHIPTVFSSSQGSFGTIFKPVLRYIILPLIQRVYWDNSAKISRVKCPCWFVAAHNDELVPVQHTHSLYAMSKADKHKTVYYDVKHNNVHDSARFYWDYNDFLDSIQAQRSL